MEKGVSKKNSKGSVRILRCGNPNCNSRIDKNKKGSSRRLGDFSFLSGVIKCPRCRCFNEILVWDGKLIQMETISPNKEILFFYEERTKEENNELSVIIEKK